jgi:peptidoglycan hydrolase-like protein with peptidoglycan-binding domain
MMLSNDMSFLGASWELYATTKNWKIIGINGTNTVYIKFRNLNNVVSAVSSHGIVFENLGNVTITPTASPSVAVQTTVAPPVVATTQTTYPVSATAFTKNLKSGDSGAEVALLQTFLEAKGFLIMPPGIQKGYFGRVTKDALVKYQKSVGLPGTGYFGPQTRAKISAGDTTMPVSVPSSTMLSTRTFHRGLSLGMRGDDVMYLQQILNKDVDTQIASTGLGSPGNESAYFGPLTEKAVQRFQVKHGIVSSGTPQTSGFGAVGPKTLLKLQEVSLR